MRLLAPMLLLLCVEVAAHQWTPTYPEFRLSYIGGIHTTDMKLYNNRGDVDYYQIQVFDGEFNPIRFAINGGQSDVVNVPYKKTRTVAVYVPSEQKSKVVYVCSKSMILKREESASLLSSRICSKVK